MTLEQTSIDEAPKKNPAKTIDMEQLAHKEILSVPEVAVLSGLSEPYVWLLLRENEGPRSFKVGNRRLIYRSDWQKWIDAKREASAA